MRWINATLFCASLMFSSHSFAAEYPEDGVWWNPDAAGRGYLIERQGNQMSVSSFHYGTNGDQEWLTMFGEYTPNIDPTDAIGSFLGETSSSTDGQCIGCSYVEPTTVPSAQGEATIVFTTNQQGTLSWFGESVPIERTFWAFESTLGQLQGTWALSIIEDGVASTQLVRIASSITADNENSLTEIGTDVAIGSISSVASGLQLNLIGGGLALEIRMPETNRFYAGAGSSSSAQVVATRVDDVPLATDDAATVSDSVFDAFGANVYVVYNTGAGTVTFEAVGQPDHRSPYWNPNGSSGLYEAPGPETTVARMSPGFIDNYTNRYFLTVPLDPQKAASTTATTLGAIGIAITGSPIFNGQEGPAINLDSGVISGFDDYGAHTGPQVYHYHLEPTPISNDDSKVFAVLRDGFFLYGRKCVSVTDNDGHPQDLDTSGGHISITQYSTTPIYHYHIKNQIYLTVNNKADYLLFDGAYRGTPNTISN